MRLGDRCLAALALGVLLLCRWCAPADETRLSAARPVLKVAPLQLPTFVRQDVLRSGETLGELAVQVGLPAGEATEWLSEAQRVLDLHSLPVGLVAETVTDVHGSVEALRLTPDWRTTVVVERRGGTILARREARPVERDLVVVDGTVQSNLFDAMGATGESENLALELADLFQWDIDFHREVRERGHFRAGGGARAKRRHDGGVRTCGRGHLHEPRKTVHRGPLRVRWRKGQLLRRPRLPPAQAIPEGAAAILAPDVSLLLLPDAPGPGPATAPLGSRLRRPCRHTGHVPPRTEWSLSPAGEGAAATRSRSGTPERT